MQKGKWTNEMCIRDRLESIDYQIDGAEETTVRYTEYQYDRRGQTTGYAELSQENAPTADEIKEHQIRYHYDSDGKLTKVTYPTTKNGVQALACLLYTSQFQSWQNAESDILQKHRF